MTLEQEMLAEKRFGETSYVVEATHFESFSLWKEFHKEYNWEQDNFGRFLNIGYFKGYPINLSILWAIINGHRILFYESVGMVSHYDMIKGWANKFFNHSTNADNFHNVLHFIKDTPPPKVPDLAGIN